MLKLKLQYIGHPMQRVDSLEKTLILGRIGGVKRAEVTPWQAVSIRSRPSYFWVVILSGHLDTTNQLNTDHCLPIRNGAETPGKVLRERESFECVWPMKLLCKLVTNLLKPTTNGVCSPYKFV